MVGPAVVAGDEHDLDTAGGVELRGGVEPVGQVRRRLAVPQAGAEHDGDGRVRDVGDRAQRAPRPGVDPERGRAGHDRQQPEERDDESRSALHRADHAGRSGAGGSGTWSFTDVRARRAPETPTMSAEPSSGRTRAEDPSDGGPYVRLSAVDPVLGSLARVHGRPDPFVWFAGGGADLTNFAAMVLHIGSQQISTAAALAVFGRVWDAAGGRIDPASVDALGPDRLRSLGLSSAKAAAIAGLARMHRDGTLDTDALDDLDDAAVVGALTAARGSGCGRRRCSSSTSSGVPTCCPPVTWAYGRPSARPGRCPRCRASRRCGSGGSGGRPTALTQRRCSGRRWAAGRTASVRLSENQATGRSAAPAVADLVQAGSRVVRAPPRDRRVAFIDAATDAERATGTPSASS